jgi:hypothetical protein
MELPRWPVKAHRVYDDCVDDGYTYAPCRECHDYYVARADAWEARARLACEALNALSKASWDSVDVRCYALDKLEEIGELP